MFNQNAQYYSVLQNKFHTKPKECIFIGSSREMLFSLEFNLVNMEGRMKFHILCGHQKFLLIQHVCLQGHATELTQSYVSRGKQYLSCCYQFSRCYVLKQFYRRQSCHFYYGLQKYPIMLSVALCGRQESSSSFYRRKLRQILQFSEEQRNLY